MQAIRAAGAGIVIAPWSGVRRSTAVFWVVACGLALRASGAAAQVPPSLPERWPEAASPATPPPPPPAATRWYGWQTLLADAWAVTLTIVLSASVDQHDDTAVIGAVVVGTSAFVLGAPIVHAAHGNRANAAWSLVLRVGLMGLGAGIGAASGEAECGGYQYDHEGCSVGYAAAGVLLGALMATIVDAAVLGRESIADRAGGATSVGFMPLRGGGGLSLAARF